MHGVPGRRYEMAPGNCGRSMPARYGCMPVTKAHAPGGAARLGVVVHEHAAFVGDAVDVRRLADHQAAVVTARLHPADVVAHDEQDVRLLVCRLDRPAAPRSAPVAASSDKLLRINFRLFIFPFSLVWFSDSGIALKIHWRSHRLIVSEFAAFAYRTLVL